jgi:ribosomal protein L7/L12
MKKKRCTNSSCRKVFKVDSLVCPHCGKQYPRESAVLDLRGKYTVVLTNAGIRKLHVIKVIRWHTGLGLKDAKTVADHVPSMIVTGYGASQVRELSADIRAAGGDVMFVPASRGTKGVFVLPKKAG